MKKIIKISKVFLLIATIFSYIASPVSVLADEISELPLTMTFEAVFDDDGYVDSYMLAFESSNDVYDEQKDYIIEFETTFTYSNSNEEVTVSEPVVLTVNGADMNNGSSQKLDPISKYYDGIYTLDVTVLDDANTEVYSDNYVYDYNTFKGLTGKLNGVEPITEEVGVSTIGNYDVTLEEVYTQSLNVLTGELSPNGIYRIAYEDGTYSEVMTGEVLRSTELTGTVTDLNGKLAGVYSYTDMVVIEQLVDDEVVNTYSYSYEANLNCDGDNAVLFNTLFADKAIFEDDYMIVNAKGYSGAESVITLGEIVSAMPEDMTIEVLDHEGNEIELNEEELSNEIKNNYVISFTNGTTINYTVVVRGDAELDNIFDTNDLFNESEEESSVIEAYVNGDNMPSMDMITLEVEDEDATETEPTYEEFGTITFEDVIITNELLKEEGNVDKEVASNVDLTLSFEEISQEIYVGDSVEVDVLVKSQEVTDFIDGIDGYLTNSDNLRLNEIIFNDLMTGLYNDEGRIVAVSDELVNEDVLMTLVFDAVEEGTASVELSGNISKYLDINEFDTVTMEFEVTRNVSVVSNLSSLNANVGTFDVEFDKDVTVYTLTVPHDTEKVILSGSLEDLNASVDGLIEYELTEDKTTAIITVTAEDGVTTKTYTVYIIKEEAPVIQPIVYYYYSSNNYLDTLEVDGYDIVFDRNTDEYTINVKHDVTSLDIKALAEDSRARVEITGNEDFKEGKNTVTVTVTAENGDTREYKLIVVKEEKKQAVTTTEDNSNTAEKIVIIILIVLVVLGLLYLIFKKDEEDEIDLSPKRENNKDNVNNKNVNNSKNSNKNNDKKKKK